MSGIPRATYRLQLHKDFGFDAAAAVVPYLARLGISHVYCSPIHRARPGSLHGYDVVAHDELSPELGGMPAYRRLCEALQGHGMGQLIDLVPNHMGVLGGDNAFPVDTHIRRISNRLGFSREDDPDKVERDLQQLLPPDRWAKGHQLLIWHGRRTCTARAPACERCEVAELCPKIGVARSTRPSRAPRRGRP